MPPKIVFFDIDDTLFRKWQDFMPESVLPAFRALHEAGVLTAIATGRSPCALPAKIRALAAADRFIALTAHLGDANSRWLLMKGREVETLTVSGFAIHAVYPLAVPLLAGERTLLDIRRERA